MRAMIVVLSPRESRDLLNGDLSVLVRKKFPKDYVGWMYVYVTKGKPYLSSNSLGYYIPKKYEKYMGNHNGKVIGRFWCDKVEEIKTDYAPRDTFFKECCLTPIELFDYIGHSKWYAINITKVEPFDKPKELCEFKTPIMAERYKYDLEKAYEDDDEIKTRLAEGIADPKYECANCVELTEWSEGYYGLSHAPRCGYCYIGV